MTIQEYIRIAVNGFPKNEFIYYRKYFLNMSCEHCIYNGYACKHPEENDVCIEYRVEKTHLEFEKPHTRHEKTV